MAATPEPAADRRLVSPVAVMKVDPTRLRLYATFAVLSSVALLLLALLVRPGTALKPERNAPAFEVEEAPPLPVPTSRAPNSNTPN